MKIKNFLYEVDKAKFVIISAKKIPSLENQPKSGTWLLYEWRDGKFQMPCLPEVTWPIIRDKMKFIGEMKLI